MADWILQNVQNAKMLNIWTLRNVLQNPDFEEVQALAFQKGLDFVKYFATPDSSLA